MATEDEIDLDTLYEWMDELKANIEAVQYADHEDGDHEEEPELSSYELDALWRVLLNFSGGGTVYDSELPRILSVRPEALHKFLNKREYIPRRDALMLADRMLHHLRSMESVVLARSAVAGEPSSTPSASTTPTATSLTVEYRASLWRAVPNDFTIKEKIFQLSQLLEDLLAAARSTNLPEDQAALTDIERAQLVALLSTSLEVLKAPLVEKNILEQTKSAAEKAAKKAAAKHVEEGMETAANMAVRLLTEIIKSIFMGG